MGIQETALYGTAGIAALAVSSQLISAYLDWAGDKRRYWRELTDNALDVQRYMPGGRKREPPSQPMTFRQALKKQFE